MMEKFETEDHRRQRRTCNLKSNQDYKPFVEWRSNATWWLSLKDEENGITANTCK
jgi:hypothetical protein